MMAAPMSGYLLKYYCPEQGPKHSWMLWAIIGAMTALGPILILSFRGVIEAKDAPKKEAAEKAESVAAA
jgi:hypothetical protein